MGLIKLYVIFHIINFQIVNKKYFVVSIILHKNIKFVREI